MPGKDPLAAGLSSEEEENEAPPNSASPSGGGYRFSNDKPTNFDFLSKAKSNGSGGSSGEDSEPFEHLQPLKEGGTGEENNHSPTKISSPQKRTAQQPPEGEEGEEEKVAPGGGGGSPAPKKRKNFQEYTAEYEAKQQRKATPSRSSSGSGSGGGGRLSTGMWVGVMVVVAAAIFLGYWGMSGKIPMNVTGAAAPPKKPEYSWRSARKMVHRGVKALEKEFPHQNPETFIQLSSSLTSTLSASPPTQPSCVTLLYPPEVTPAFATCFASRIGQLLNQGVAPLLQGVNNSRAAHPHPPKVMDLTDFSRTLSHVRVNLENYLRLQGKGVVMPHLTELKEESHLLFFHGLCDNFQSIDPRAAVFFPVAVSPAVKQKYEWVHHRGGDISGEVLNKAFAAAGVSADTGPALVARVADAVVLLNPGDECGGGKKTN